MKIINETKKFFIFTLFRHLIFVLIFLDTNFTSINAQTTDTTLSGLISLDLEDLLNMKVSIATRSNLSERESPSVVSVITSDEIKNSGARELADILQTIPGFELSKKFDGEYGIGIRGVKDPRCTSKLLIMVDGIPYNQILYGYSFYTGYDINIDAIERIEIIRGPGSALYGRNAFSGLINIITKSGANGEKLMLKGKAGAFGTYSASGNFGIKKEKLNASVTIGKIQTDGTNDKFDDGYGGQGLWSIYHENSTINAKINAGKFTLCGSFYDLNSGGYVDVLQINERRWYYSVNYEDSISSKMGIFLKFTGHYINHDEIYQQLKPNYDLVYPLGIYYQPKAKEYSYSFESYVKYAISNKNNLLIGIQPELYGVKDVLIYTNYNFGIDEAISGIGKDNLVIYPPGWLANNEHKFSNVALFFQDIWNPTANLSLTIGGRYDFDSEIGGVFNPRVGFYWELFKDFSIKLLYGQAYRAPSPTEQYGTLGFVIGNENLKPEKIQTSELAISFRLKKMVNSVSFFHNKHSNMIYAESKTELDPTNVYKNIGNNQSFGVEYETRILLNKNFSSYLNYSYTFSQNRDFLNNKDTIYSEADVAPHKLNLGMNYFFQKYFNFNFNMFYRSKMGKFLAPDENGNLIEVQDNIGNYAIMNSKLQIINLVKNISISFSAYNLLDTKYYSQENQYLHAPPQPGRQFMFELAYVLR
jgi:iron complex outermembrane receptor protein